MSQVSKSSLESFLKKVDVLDKRLIYPREDRLKVERIFEEYGDRIQVMINGMKKGGSSEREKATRYQELCDIYGKKALKPILGVESGIKRARQEERELRDFEMTKKHKYSFTFHPASPVVKLIGYGVTLALMGVIAYGGWQIAKHSRFFFENLGKKYDSAIEESKVDR